MMSSKNHKLSTTIMLRAFFCFTIMIACMMIMLTPNTVQAAKKVCLSVSSQTMTLGGTAKISLNNSNSKIAWETSDSSVVTCSKSGKSTKLIATGEGNAIITATYNGLRYQCAVCVKKPSFSVEKVQLALKEKKTIKLYNTTGTVKWKNSNTKIVTLKKTKNNVITITGKTAGTAVITAVNCGNTVSCTVTVKNPELDQQSMTIELGESKELTVNSSYGKVSFNANDTSVTDLVKNTETQYSIVGKKIGTSTITVTNAGQTLTCQVNVIAAHVHTYKEINRIESTCGTKGRVDYACECGHKKSEDLSLSQVHGSTKTYEKAATCLTDGEKKEICSICGKTIRYTIIPAKDHTYIESEKCESTCKQKGSIKYRCSECGAEKNEIIPIVEHRFDESDGIRTCIWCGLTDYAYTKNGLILDMDFTGLSGQKITSLKDKAHGYEFQNFQDCEFNVNGIRHGSTCQYPYSKDAGLINAIKKAMTTGEGISFEVYGDVVAAIPTMGYRASNTSLQMYSPTTVNAGYYRDVDQLWPYTIDIKVPYIDNAGNMQHVSKNTISKNTSYLGAQEDDVWHLVTSITPDGKVKQYINGVPVVESRISDDFEKFVFENYSAGKYSFKELYLFNNFQTTDANRFITTIRIYDHLLTMDEIKKNYQIEQKKIKLLDLKVADQTVTLENGDDYNVYASTFPKAVDATYTVSKTSSVITIKGETNDVTMKKSIGVTNKTLKYHIQSSREYNGIAIARKTNELEVGEEFVCQAYALSEVTMEHPFRYNVYDDNYVVYESNNAAVCSVKNGVLFGNKEGTAVITATAGSVSESFTVKVTAAARNTSTDAQMVSLNFDNTNAKVCTQAIISILENVKGSGKRKVVFPESEYHISPEYGTIKIPSNTVVDFSGSILQIEPSVYTKKGYNMFLFENTEYSEIRNAVIYGERYLMEGTGAEACQSVCFKGYNYRSGLYKCTISRSPGFNIGATRTNTKMNALKLNSLEAGGIGSDGTEIDQEYTFRNNDYIKLPQTDWYAFGNMQGYQGYAYLSARVYHIYYYNSDKEYIGCLENCLQYYRYDRPRDAVYCRITFRLGTKPTKCDGDYYGIAHIYYMDEPDSCYIRDCKLTNNYSTAIQPNAGCSWMIDNCYFKDNGLRDPYSHIDWEDGRNNNKGHVVRNCTFENSNGMVGGGCVIAVNADGLAIHNNVFVNANLTIGDEVQNSRVWLNQFVGSNAVAKISTKTDMVFSQNYGSNGASCVISDTPCCTSYSVLTAANSFGKYTDKTSAKSGHEYVEKERIEPTEDCDGKIIYTCTKCKMTCFETYEVIPRLDTLDSDCLALEDETESGAEPEETNDADQESMVCKENVESDEVEGFDSLENIESYERITENNMIEDENEVEAAASNEAMEAENRVTVSYLISGTEFRELIDVSNITEIRESYKKSKSSMVTISTSDSEESVFVWVKDSILYWYSEADTIYRDVDSSYFEGAEYLTDYSNIDSWN